MLILSNMSLNSPDVSVVPEPNVQNDAMKGMAKDILTTAQDIITERRLEPTPQGGNFAWTVLGKEAGKGYIPAHSAVNLHEVAESGTKSSTAELDQKIAQITDPKLKEETERTRDANARSLGINFDGVSDPALRQVYSNNVARGLVGLFAEKLGFTQPGEKIDVNNPRVKQEGNKLILDHPDNPFILELPIVGSTPSGGADFRSFVTRYTPK